MMAWAALVLVLVAVGLFDRAVHRDDGWSLLVAVAAVGVAVVLLLGDVR